MSVRGCSIASFEKSAATFQSRGRKKKAGTERERERERRDAARSRRENAGITKHGNRGDPFTRNDATKEAHNYHSCTVMASVELLKC